jgi:hypothetical protein
MIFRKVLFILFATLAFSGCAYQQTVEPGKVDKLTKEIMALGPSVDPDEARRAAEISVYHSLDLAKQYNITDLPIIHNEKVHQGLRERGLCNHWAEDLSKRLKQENFSTLEIKRAISPPTEMRIIHHTAVITKPGDTIYDGVVVDPWRYGGALFHAPTKTDKRYNWRPREEVLVELVAASEEKAAKNAN